MALSTFRIYPARPVARASAAVLLIGSLAMAGCSAIGGDKPEQNTEAQQSKDGLLPGEPVQGVKGTELPVDTLPAPVGQGDSETRCPYLDGEWLQTTTGQRWTATGLDGRFDPPACVFWSYEDVPQAQVMVRHMTTNKDAVAVVDHAAPVDSTLKALKPEGWSGGRSGGKDGEGAVYAVWKDQTAVVVFTAQEQSLKAEQIATETIKNLKL